MLSNPVRFTANLKCPPVEDSYSLLESEIFVEREIDVLAFAHQRDSATWAASISEYIDLAAGNRAAVKLFNPIVCFESCVAAGGRGTRFEFSMYLSRQSPDRCR